MSDAPVTSIVQIVAWRESASESQQLEFKEARSQFEMSRLREYCVALANEGGGLRELIANALIHQDLDVSGATVMVEIYTDRIEVSNPGQPGVQPERFIDEYRCRNEPLADLMRRFGICEEKGSGIDKVVQAVEEQHLPAPEFRVDSVRTTCVLHGARAFADMSRDDRVRACYQHCCLRYVSNEPMTNRSLRERFGLAEHQSAVASHVITATQAAALIKPDGALTSSKRYARYVPFWA